MPHKLTAILLAVLFVLCPLIKSASFGVKTYDDSGDIQEVITVARSEPRKSVRFSIGNEAIATAGRTEATVAADNHEANRLLKRSKSAPAIIECHGSNYAPETISAQREMPLYRAHSCNGPCNSQGNWFFDPTEVYGDGYEPLIGHVTSNCRLADCIRESPDSTAYLLSPTGSSKLRILTNSPVPKQRHGSHSLLARQAVMAFRDLKTQTTPETESINDDEHNEDPSVTQAQA